MSEQKIAKLEVLNKLKNYTLSLNDNSSKTMLYAKICNEIEELEIDSAFIKELEIRKTAEGILMYTSQIDKTDSNRFTSIDTIDTLCNYIIELTEDFI